METPKTTIYTFWYDTKTPFSLENHIRAKMLGMAMDKIYTQMIREDAGAAYSVMAAGASQFEGDNPVTTVLAICPIKPEFTQQTLEIMNNQMVEAGKSIDATSIMEFKNEILKDHESALKENSYWVRILTNYVERGIDSVTGFEKVVNAQTPETVAAFARHLVQNGNKLEAVLTPKE